MNWKKKPIAKIRLKLLANKAAPSPLLGQALGQYGINIMEFCKNFNNKTKNIKQEIYIPTIIYLYNREDYEIMIKTPTTSYLIKKIAKVVKATKKKKQGILYLKEIYHLAIFKKCDKILNNIDVKALCKTIIGTAKSIGLIIKK